MFDDSGLAGAQLGYGSADWASSLRIAIQRVRLTAPLGAVA